MAEFLIKDEDLTSLKGKVAIVTGTQTHAHTNKAKKPRPFGTKFRASSYHGPHFTRPWMI